MLLPMVETAAQLDDVREGLWMPPRGNCRPGGHANWWLKDYQYTSFKNQIEDDFIIMTQIESPLGLKNIDAIANHEITTALAIGPYDMSARLGVCWQPEHPELQAAIQGVRDAATRAGKAMWMIGDGPTLRAKGFNFLCVAEPSFFLKAALANLVTATRSPKGDAKSDAFIP
jgi:2-keto-3-deoxy-L-rhamnonate aldolase RhmA